MSKLYLQLFSCHERFLQMSFSSRKAELVIESYGHKSLPVTFPAESEGHAYDDDTTINCQPAIAYAGHLIQYL